MPCDNAHASGEVPPEGELRGSDDTGEDECLIKMLGSWERRQVAMTLYRHGVQGALFGDRCPMSRHHKFATCPFYEDVADIDDDK